MSQKDPDGDDTNIAALEQEFNTKQVQENKTWDESTSSDEAVMALQLSTYGTTKRCYISATIKETDFTLVADTGSPITVVSSFLARRIRHNENVLDRMLLHPSHAKPSTTRP